VSEEGRRSLTYANIALRVDYHLQASTRSRVFPPKHGVFCHTLDSMKEEER